MERGGKGARVPLGRFPILTIRVDCYLVMASRGEGMGMGMGRGSVKRYRAEVQTRWSFATRPAVATRGGRKDSRCLEKPRSKSQLQLSRDRPSWHIISYPYLWAMPITRCSQNPNMF
eukprot:9499325-Pyramimonas_sp.AAC.1